MQNTEQAFREQMTKHGLRVTENRLAIIQAFLKEGKPLSIQEIIGTVSGVGSLSSVYRSVESMTKIGVLRVVPRGFKNLYELGESLWPHHHHVTCEYCGLSASIDDDEIEALIHKLTLSVGLEPTRHEIELFGICQKCGKL